MVTRKRKLLKVIILGDSGCVFSGLGEGGGAPLPLSRTTPRSSSARRARAMFRTLPDSLAQSLDDARAWRIRPHSPIATTKKPRRRADAPTPTPAKQKTKQTALARRR
jgi:hypothetical protein